MSEPFYFENIGREPLHLVTLGNTRFAPGLAVMLRTACVELNQARTVKVLLCSIGLDTRNADKLEQTVAESSSAGTVTRLELTSQPGFRALEQVMNDLNIHHRVARCWFAKIAAIEAAAKAGWPWCLFVDGDVIVQRDFGELLKPSAFPLKAVEDKGTVAWSHGAGVPDFKAAELASDAPFFNSGVMLVDLAWWRQEGVFQQCLEWAPRLRAWFTAHQHGLQFSDQNVLNVVFHNRWETLHGDWNRQGTLGEGLLRGFSQGEPAVFHFCTNPKPWDRPVDVNSSPFFRVLDETPYRGWRPPWWLGIKFLMSKVKCRASQWGKAISSRPEKLEH